MVSGELGRMWPGAPGASGVQVTDVLMALVLLGLPTWLSLGGMGCQEVRCFPSLCDLLWPLCWRAGPRLWLFPQPSSAPRGSSGPDEHEEPGTCPCKEQEALGCLRFSWVS